MTAAADRLRRFSAHCSNERAVASGFVTAAQSFEEAALLFAERWAGEEEACRVIVVDTESGEQHCFSIDIDQGHVDPC
jgi:hypothetical protein